MKQTTPTRTVSWAVLLCALLPGVVGCNDEVAGQVATLSGAFLDDIVGVLVTGSIHEALGIDDSGTTHEHSEDEHTHDDDPLHDHEH